MDTSSVGLLAVEYSSVGLTGAIMHTIYATFGFGTGLTCLD